MPEGPEIRCFADQLREIVSETILKVIKLHRGPYTTSEKPKYSVFREAVKSYIPHRVTSVRSKGKNLYILFDGDEYAALLVHHGMEGSWCEDPNNSHIIIEFGFEGENTTLRTLYFQDSRRFGTFSLLTQNEYEASLLKLGPDVYSFEDPVAFWEHLRSIKRIQSHRLCEVLLDQTVISGIGNYMRADILYRAGLDPRRTVGSMSDGEMCNLFIACFRVAWGSYNCKATVPGSYDSSIHSGNYQTIVYGCERCPRGYRVEKFTDKKKRAMWWVPEHQSQLKDDTDI